MTSRWNWLKERLVTINSNPSRFAKDIGWQASRVYELFSGKTKAIPLDKIALAATKLSVSLDSMINFNSGQADEVQFIDPNTIDVCDSYVSTSIPEIDAYAPSKARYGGTMLCDSRTIFNGVGLDEKIVVSNWKIPDDYLTILKVKPSNTYIFEALSDNMAPTINSGDKLIVDVAYRGKLPSPSGIYAIWDGSGIDIKRLELVPNTLPQRILISSDNKRNKPFERKSSECCIIGKVAGVIKRL